MDLLSNRIPPGVDEAAYVKLTSWLLSQRKNIFPLLTPTKAIELLGTMQGGYNIYPLIDVLDDEQLAPIAAKALSHTLLMFDNFYDVEQKQTWATHMRVKCYAHGQMPNGFLSDLH